VVALHAVAGNTRTRLRSADPFMHPRPDPHYYSDPTDLLTMVSGLRVIVEIVRHDPLPRFIDRLSLQSSDESNCDMIVDHVWLWTQAPYHVVGTCAMVDDEFRRRPVPVFAATIMIGEKGADFVRITW
jgi:choline dehydrogenase